MVTKRTRKREGQIGAPRFLEVIQSCLERRAKLLGLDAPEKFAETDSDGNDLTDEERVLKIAEIMERARKRRLAAEGKGGATDDDEPTVH